jgi:hypothetical protein
MFEKIGRLAEQVASNVAVSRRGFLGRLGRAALGAAGVVGGLSALAGRAQAGQNNLYACEYESKPRRQCGYAFCGSSPSCGGCPSLNCCRLVSKTIIGTC